MRKLLEFIFYFLLPCAASLAGYQATDEFFKRKMIPFPFEAFGVAVAFGCFFLALGAGLLIQTLWQKKRSSS